MKKVFISGILGMDASTLAEHLLFSDDYEVYGLLRRSSNPNYNNIQGIKNHPRLRLCYGDISDRASLMDLIGSIKPDYFINFAGFTFTEPSWECPAAVMEVNFGGCLNALEAIRKLQPYCRFFQAGSSEVFGNVEFYPQNEKTKHNPRNFYGISKSSAAHAVRLYREKYGMFAVNGYLYNHESHKRNEQYVFAKVCKGIAKINFSLKHKIKFDPIELGNLDCSRDWSDAEDIVDGIWRQITYKEPIDFVFASGKLYTVAQIVEEACKICDIQFVKEQENYYLISTGQQLTKVNHAYFRTENKIPLLGDSNLAHEILNWKPQTDFKGLIDKIIISETRHLEGR